MRRLLFVALALTLGLVVTDLARHPAVLSDPAAPVYLVILGIVAAGYVAANLLVTREAGPLGALFGVVVCGLWAAELWAGNIAPPGPATAVVYYSSTASVLVASVVGGVFGGRLRGRLADGASVGAVSGMLGGMFVCAVAVSGGAVSTAAQAIDPATTAGYADSLAAGINHLWIGLGVGSLCGLIGGTVGAALGRGRARPPAAS
jgi:hypothetical protein